jgi:archaellum biogenesis ATPase FlaH
MMQKKNFIGFKDRVLLHLLQYEKDVYDNIHGSEIDGTYKDFLFHLTQDGISEGVGTKQSTIYKELQNLKIPAIESEEPLIQTIDRVRIPGKERACSIYFLTQYGSDLAAQKKTYLENKNVEVNELDCQESHVIRIGDLVNRLISEGKDSNSISALLKIALLITPEGMLDWQKLISTPYETVREGIEKVKVEPLRTPTLEITNPFFNRIAIKDNKYFFGRKDEVQYIISLLRNAQSCSIVGPRRIGKSSLINYISDPLVLKENGLNPNEFIFVPIDLEGLGELTPSEFFSMIIQELRNKIIEKELRRGMEELLSKENIRFLDLKNIFMDIKELEKNVIFLFDEFELITTNKNLDINFFSGLRNLANNFSVCYITASHVPLLELTLSQETLGSPFFNFFTQINLGLMNDDDVQELITTLSTEHEVKFPEDVINNIKDTAGNHPFFIQMLSYHIYNWIIDHKNISEPDLQIVSETFYKEARPHFQYFWNHLLEGEQKLLMIINKHEGLESQPNYHQTTQNLKLKALVIDDGVKFQLFSKSFIEFIDQIEQVSILPKAQQEVTKSPDMVSEEISVKDEPELEVASEPEEARKLKIEWGCNYFVDEDTLDETVKLFNELTQIGIPGLFITRTPSEKAEKQWELSNSKIIWLCSRTGGEYHYLPPALEKINHTIHEFIRQNENSVIMLDGIEYIVNNNDFLKTLSLMDNLKEIIGINKAIFLFPLSSSIFSHKEMALFGKNSIEILKDVKFEISELEIDEK